jgi:hypothetical protein
VIFPFFSRSSTRTTPRMHSLMKVTPPSRYPRFRIHTLPIDLQVFCVVLPPRSTTPPCHPSTRSTTLSCRRSTPVSFVLPCWGAGAMQSCCCRTDGSPWRHWWGAQYVQMLTSFNLTSETWRLQFDAPCVVSSLVWRPPWGLNEVDIFFCLGGLSGKTEISWQFSCAKTEEIRRRSKEIFRLQNRKREGPDYAREDMASLRCWQETRGDDVLRCLQYSIAQEKKKDGVVKDRYTGRIWEIEFRTDHVWRRAYIVAPDVFERLSSGWLYLISKITYEGGLI